MPGCTAGILGARMVAGAWQTSTEAIAGSAVPQLMPWHQTGPRALAVAMMTKTYDASICHLETR